MAERIDVMISSTARDLPEHRQQAFDACVRQGMFPIMMEHLPASDHDAISASMAMVDEAEIYLGIIGQRYGYIPKGHAISITEMEYNHAAERNIPRLIFIMAGDHEALRTPSEDDPAKLKAFKDRVQTEQVVNFFSSPADLRAQIINSLADIHKRRTSQFHRPSLIPSAPEAYIAHPYTLLETEKLHGRQQELNALSSWLRGEKQPTIKNVVAIGGMGKSSLTWKWFHDVAPNQCQLAGRMWWSFYESDAHYENFLTRALAYASAQPEDAIRKLRLPQREEQLLSILSSQPFLLVLDGLERLLIAYSRQDALREAESQPAPKSADALHHLGTLPGLRRQFDEQHRLRKTADPRAGNLLRKLASIGKTKILISTRLRPADLETASGQEIPGSSTLHLGGLGDQDAVELWKSFGCTGTRKSLIKLFNAFDNYPLLIRTLAGDVARYRRAPGDFDRWRKANPNLDPSALPLVQRQSHVLQFALNGLDAAQIQVLRTVAAFNSPATYGTLADLLIDDAQIFESETVLDQALTELEDRGLLGWDRHANRYDLHPVVRGVVWHTLEKSAQKDIYKQLRTHLEAMPSVDNWRKVSKPEDINANLELYHTLIGLEYYEEAADVLENRLVRAVRYRLSDGQLLANLLEMLFPDGQELPKLGEAGRQAWVLNTLARAYQMIGQPGRAVPLFERSNQLKEDHHYTVDLSTGLRDLSYSQRLVGGLYPAEAAARRALLLDRQDDNRLLEAISLQVLGLALAARGEYAESEKALDRSLDLADRTNANRAYNHHAIRALWFGDHSSALDWSEKGIRYSEQRKLEPSLILATRLQGEAALGLRDLRLAEDRLHNALVHAREVRLVEEEIAALIALANLRRLQTQFDAARDHLNDAWHAIEVGQYRLFHADAFNVLAHIERDAEQSDAAILAATQAYQLSWCDAPPYAYHSGLRKAETQLKILEAPIPALPHDLLKESVKMVPVEINPTPEG